MGESKITEQEWIILAGEEAGPRSNKMGGIWNVINSEASTLASIIDSEKIESIKENIPKILVFGPYYGYKGADWNKGLNRITDMSEFKSPDMDDELEEAIEAVKPLGIELITGSRKIGNIDVRYLMFKTDNFSRCITRYKNREMSLDDKIKAEAYDLVGLDSLTYQNMWNGMEYTHYLNLSYAISEFIRALVTIKEKDINEQSDIEISEFAKSLLPSMQVSLHGHEFGVFYAIARLEKLGIPVRTVATFHATLPGRSAGYHSIEKINSNDSTWVKDVPSNLASLESLGKCADIATAVGDSTRKEAKLFYGLDPIVVRNGITLDKSEIPWDKKTQKREKIQKFLSKRLHEIHDGESIPYKKIIPIFTRDGVQG